ncbi:MAG: hypothetical protein L0Y56_15915, partial [Nitrospira sp.]|nr:hypothetical protein [Nitrospira sp.]
MKTYQSYLVAGSILVLTSLSLLWIISYAAPPNEPFQTYHSELEYLKSMNSAGPAHDPQIIFLLMAQYLNAHQPKAG